MTEAINPAMGTIISWKAPKEVLIEALENALEDAGYFCVDNLPPTLLRDLVATRKE